MIKKSVGCVACAAVLAVLLAPCFAAAPVKIEKVAPAADLVLEAEAKIQSLEAALESNDTYLQGKKTQIPTDAGVLAVLAQAIAESSEDSALKKSAPALRDAAISVAQSTSFDAAKAGLAAVKEAHGGKAGTAKLDHEWNKLARLGKVMTEVQKRTGKIRKNVRKAPTDANAASRDASVVAVLALAAHDDTHEVKDPAQVPKWKGFALEMQTSMSAVAAGFKANDAAATKSAFEKAGKSCSECHDAFREKE